MGIDDESSHPAIMCSEVAGGVTRKIVCLFREPDAGNLPVRFDEREQETELSPTGLRRRRESFVNGHRETKATAPVLDSTRRYTHRLIHTDCGAQKRLAADTVKLVNSLGNRTTLRVARNHIFLVNESCGRS